MCISSWLGQGPHADTGWTHGCLFSPSFLPLMPQSQESLWLFGASQTCLGPARVKAAVRGEHGIVSRKHLEVLPLLHLYPDLQGSLPLSPLLF